MGRTRRYWIYQAKVIAGAVLFFIGLILAMMMVGTK